MKEIKKCSISGIGFTLDTDAYEELAAYLESLKAAYRTTPDGSEIVADIEARIAELILSVQDSDRIVEKPLILNIIQQMGTAEDLSGQDDEPFAGHQPRIPRRLYRDTENAKLGGVCAGIGKYFDMDPVWVRLAAFLPLVLTCMGGIPFFGSWMAQIFGNLFMIFVICYLIMWFAVPAARTARQKLEMNGEKITVNSIRETVEAASNDADSHAKPIVADVVSVTGKVLLILLKIFAGFLVFGLIMCACALIIGLFFLIVGGEGLFTPEFLGVFVSPWMASLGVVTMLIPVILLIYVFMCLVASRKPGGKTVLGIFLVWLSSIIAFSAVGIREFTGERLRDKQVSMERTVRDALQQQIVIDGDTTTFERLIEEYDDESIVEESRRRLHISIPSKQLEITVDKQKARLDVKAGGKKFTLRADDRPANLDEVDTIVRVVGKQATEFDL